MSGAHGQAPLERYLCQAGGSRDRVGERRPLVLDNRGRDEETSLA
jgi:hypothetical protein